MTAFWDPHTIVGDLQLQCVGGFVYRETDVAGLGPGMTRDVGESLLDYAVGSHLHGGGQRRQLLTSLHAENELVLAVFV